MTGRIYIRDFSYEATAEDISILITKVCPVVEVYISGPTPTGINRSFAIVVVNANNLLVEKCIKTFNNCHWKGTRIFVEKAKEYYKDRLGREQTRDREAVIESLRVLSLPSCTTSSSSSVITGKSNRYPRTEKLTRNRARHCKYGKYLNCIGEEIILTRSDIVHTDLPLLLFCSVLLFLRVFCSILFRSENILRLKERNLYD